MAKHKSDAEMSTNIEKQFEGALNAFQAEHGTLPERIFFYRDGVGEFAVGSTADSSAVWQFFWLFFEHF